MARTLIPLLVYLPRDLATALLAEAKRQGTRPDHNRVIIQALRAYLEALPHPTDGVSGCGVGVEGQPTNNQRTAGAAIKCGSCGEIAQREEARDWFRVTSPDGVKIGDFSQMRHGSFCSVVCLQQRLWEASWGQWYIDPVNGPARVPNWTPNKQED